MPAAIEITPRSKNARDWTDSEGHMMDGEGGTVERGGRGGGLRAALSVSGVSCISCVPVAPPASPFPTLTTS